MLFSALLLISLVVFWTSLKTLVHFSLGGDHQYDKYSYTIAIPFISAVIVFFEREKIFASVQYAFRTGLALLLTALILNWTAGLAVKQLEENALSARILALVIIWLAAFVVCFGVRALWVGAFPFALLFLTVPIPDVVLDKPITAVRYGSTEVCSLIFTLGGVPALRNGLEFTLSTVKIEVAKECSGIHSTLAILIISLVAGHFCLPSVWKKVVLVLSALPVVCITNGLRITLLTLLAEYVNPGFLRGNLHRQGGVGFFLLAVVWLFEILQLLRRGQRRETPEPKSDSC